MANPPRPKRKPKVSKPLFPGRDKKRYETWKRYGSGAGEQREGYLRARRAIKRAEQRGERPSSWDKKIVKEYKPETVEQRQEKKDLAKEGAIQIGYLAFPYARALKMLNSVAGRKRGGKVKKKTGKKYKRAALRGHRSELRGG